eukprot:CAMPEP_0206486154 /NCGR_PEP_ID=MMETSP0324_2-20121206/40892_1 /ASSEMBLY_ACC=CAM_ASM_000836 /TAXON_ID=2866 /ORGANISM="Crypthecodinium cohnii, Strain Seligo" /LENGTH=690 /DNA_ID=CAMNT_0053964421 /DNA_START=96 /DNA_END=2168 /DNA_ORIENTATION=+
MKLFSLAVLLAVMAVVPGEGALKIDLVGDKNRPVTKVITLLKDMLKQLQKEQEDDEAVYDKMACWCQTNDKEKTKAISDAEARIEDLTTKVEEHTAASARLDTEIKNLEKEVAQNQDSLDKAIAIRQKQLAEFNAEEKDLLQSISALKSAITVLSKHHSAGALVQMSRSNVLTIAASLGHALQRHASMLQGVLTPSELRAAAAFVQAPEDYFDATPTFRQSYAPQSGEIFGILRQMKDTFESNLSASQKEELANQKAYEDLKAAKEAEIAAGQQQLDTKTRELALTNEKNAQAKVDIEDTKASLSADEQFLMMLKEKCSLTDKEWEERQKTRADEMKAVSEALAVLSGDDAHDLFTRTFNPSFLQRSSSSSSSSDRRSAASALLARVAERLHSPRLATLAYNLKLDAFTRVKKAIDDMVTQLLKEQEDEVKHKDFCTGEFNTNQLQTEKKERTKEDLLASIEDLEMTIDELAKAIDELNAEIAEMQVQLKRAGEDREKENAEFQTTVADQRETQKLLKTALQVLGDFYNKKTASLLQRQEPAGPPPPAGFETYKNNAGSGGVMSLLQQIISDAKAMEVEALHGEQEAQKAYEAFVKETNGSVESKQKDIVNKSQQKAKSETDLIEAKEAKEGVILELEQLSKYNAELHSSCDFILKNFDLRQTARSEEVEALRQAKAILSGANFQEFLQG